MKKVYREPELELIRLNDVITASGVSGEPDNFEQGTEIVPAGQTDNNPDGFEW